MSTATTFAVAHIGNCRIGIDVAWVGGALSAQTALQPPPRRQGALAGLAPTPQGLLPVADLRRWLPFDAPQETARNTQAILVLQRDGRRIGIQVDTTAGLVHIAPEGIERLFHDAQPEELFDQAAMTSDGHRIDLLDPARLMDLMAVWSGSDPRHAGAREDTAAVRAGRCALLQCAGMWLGVPVECAGEMAPLPALDLNMPRGGTSRGVATWRGRPVAMLDPWRLLDAVHEQDSAPEKWAMVLTLEKLALLLPAQSFIGLADIPPVQDGADDAAPPLLRRWIDPSQRQVHLLDAAGLLRRLPEAALGRDAGAVPAASGVTLNPCAYMVFESDGLYALAIDDVQAVLHGTPEMADKDLLEWRGHQLPLRRDTALQGSVPPVILILGAGAAMHARAVRRLLTLVPARSGRLLPIPGAPGQHMLTLEQPRASYRIFAPAGAAR